MPTYNYLCRFCEHEHQFQCAIADRNEVGCPACHSGPKHQEIQLQATPGKMGHQDKMISTAETEHKYGHDWRETPESKHIMADTAKRTYSDGGKK